MATKQKLTLYLSEDILEETKIEALRQDRTISWLLQKAWLIARQEIQRFPSPDDHLLSAIQKSEKA